MKQKTVNCTVLMTNEAEKQQLCRFLSCSDSLNVVSLVKTPIETIGILRNVSAEILFVDTKYDYLLQNVHRPSFVIGICQNTQKEDFPTFIGKGFFDILFLPLDEKKVLNILCKVFNIHNFYLHELQIAQPVEEERITYNREQIGDSLYNKEYMFILVNRKKKF